MSGWFCFVPWRKCDDLEDGYEPAELEGWRVEPVTFGVAERWLVGECTPIDRDASLPEVYERVPGRLRYLLRSAKRYYPAVALARAFLRYDESLLPDDKEQYATKLADEIERHLKAQREVPYFMAQAIEPCHIGYRSAGEYVWLVAYDPNRKKVFWVTDDYFVYDSPIGHFLLDEEQVRSLPVRYLPPGYPED